MKPLVKENILFSTGALVNRELFFISAFGNVFSKLNLDTLEVSIIDINEEDMQYIRAISYMLETNGKIFALELGGKYLLEYKMSDNLLKKYQIDCNKKAFGNFVAFAECENRLFIFPKTVNAVVILDLETGNITREAELYEIFCKEGDFSCACQVDYIMWLFMENSSIAVAYNMSSKEFGSYHLPQVIQGCKRAHAYKGEFFILDNQARVYSWDCKTEQAELLVDLGKYQNKMDENTNGMVVATDRNLWILPSFGRDIFILDRGGRKIICYQGYPADFSYIGPPEWSKYVGYVEDDGGYYFSMNSANYILHIDKETGIGSWLKPKGVKLEKWWNILHQYKKNRLTEWDMPLEEFLLYIERIN